MKKLLILDRDGVINFDSPNYIRSEHEWIAIPQSIKAISMACKKGYVIAVATNQAGLAKGFFTVEALDAMHEKMSSLVAKAGGKISSIKYCPHHPDDNCRCRKPAAGMLTDLCQMYSASPQDVWFVGDSLKDLQAGSSIGCKTALVLTGNGRTTQRLLNEDKIFEDTLVFKNLYGFCNHLNR